MVLSKPNGFCKKIYIYLKIVGSWLMIISISEEAWSSINIIKTLKNNKGNVFNLMKDMYQNLKQTFNRKTSDACHLR